MQSDPAEIKPAQCCIKLVFHLSLASVFSLCPTVFCSPYYFKQTWCSDNPLLCEAYVKVDRLGLFHLGRSNPSTRSACLTPSCEIKLPEKFVHSVRRSGSLICLDFHIHHCNAILRFFISSVLTAAIETTSQARLHSSLSQRSNHSQSLATLCLFLAVGLSFLFFSPFIKFLFIFNFITLFNIFTTLHFISVGRVAQSVQRLITGWIVRDRIAMGDEILRPSRPVLGPTQTPVKWVTGLSRG